MSDDQERVGGKVSLEGLIFRKIDNLTMENKDTWYEYNPNQRMSSLLIQCSGDVAIDMSLSSGESAEVWTIKSQQALGLDAQVGTRKIYFRHHENTAQKLQVVRLL